MKRSLAVACLSSVLLFGPDAYGGAKGNFSGTFEPILEPACIHPLYFNGFTVGGQYRDANNGVIPDQYSMLVRWQGDGMTSSTVSYDLGRWTGLHGVPQYGQRGYQPESANGTPGVQVNCRDIGMLINSWANPHRPIVGGGYNDMWGYAWTWNRPRPFVTPFGGPSHLVLQANIGVNFFYPKIPSDPAANKSAGTGQIGFFAYVRDVTNQHLPPIVILAMAYDSTWVPSYATTGFFGIDYNNDMTVAYRNANPNWFAPGQTGEGVWFVSGPISKRSDNIQPFVDTYYTDGEENSAMNPTDHGGNPPSPFFRAHISAKNMEAIVAKIESAACPLDGVRACLAKGYSRSAADYELEYAGLIAETTITGETEPTHSYDVGPGPGQWTYNNANRNQVVLGLRAFDFGIYRATPS